MCFRLSERRFSFQTLWHSLNSGWRVWKIFLWSWLEWAILGTAASLNSQLYWEAWRLLISDGWRDWRANWIFRQVHLSSNSVHRFEKNQEESRREENTTEKRAGTKHSLFFFSNFIFFPHKTELICTPSVFLKSSNKSALRKLNKCDRHGYFKCESKLQSNVVPQALLTWAPRAINSSFTVVQHAIV